MAIFFIRSITNIQPFEKSLGTRMNKSFSDQFISNTHVQVTKRGPQVSHRNIVEMQRTLAFNFSEFGFVFHWSCFQISIEKRKDCRSLKEINDSEKYPNWPAQTSNYSSSSGHVYDSHDAETSLTINEKT